MLKYWLSGQRTTYDILKKLQTVHVDFRNWHISCDTYIPDTVIEAVLNLKTPILINLNTLCRLWRYAFRYNILCCSDRDRDRDRDRGTRRPGPWHQEIPRTIRPTRSGQSWAILGDPGSKLGSTNDPDPKNQRSWVILTDPAPGVGSLGITLVKYGGKLVSLLIFTSSSCSVAFFRA